MTQAEALALSPGQSVTYRPNPNETPIICTVRNNGPRRDVNGYPIPFMNDVLVVQLGNGPATVTWEPEHCPDGIPELNL